MYLPWGFSCLMAYFTTAGVFTAMGVSNTTGVEKA
jgi:hypothetical protein